MRQERIRQERKVIVRRPNPRGNQQPSQEELEQSAREHAEYEQWMEEGYQAARQARYEENQQEWEEWREKRREERQAEQERYEILKEEHRAEKLANDPDWISWQETLRQLGGCR